jgi:hypothetical protein
MKIWERFRKRKQLKAIRNYILLLPKILGDDYGFSQTYTPEQIKSAIERNDLDNRFISYAVAMFTTPEVFDRYHKETGVILDYNRLRREIQSNFFDYSDGYPGDFTYRDIVHMSSSHGHGVSVADSVGHGGAEHGGGGHGGDGHH